MTKGQIEASITAALTQFERDHLGRGPREARTFVVQDLVVVRLRGILSPAEQQVSQEANGVALIKEVRSRLIESSSDHITGIIEGHTGIRVATMHTDISTRTGERVFVFGLEESLEERLEQD
ncbi:MAG: DUF2294 domain-containing protein [Rhodothermales bacterium]|nr:DUF2294 domain-containing protein [Rhodothermales bacterium]